MNQNNSWIFSLVLHSRHTFLILFVQFVYLVQMLEKYGCSDIIPFSTYPTQHREGKDQKANAKNAIR